MSRRVSPRHRAPHSTRRPYRVRVVLALAAMLCLTASGASGLAPGHFLAGAHYGTLQSPGSAVGAASAGRADSTAGGRFAAAAGGGAAGHRQAPIPTSTPHHLGSKAPGTGAAGSSAGTAPAPGHASGTPGSQSPGSQSPGSQSPGSPGSAPPANPSQPTQSAGSPHPSSVQIGANIAAVPSSDSTCRSAPNGAACTNAAIAALNHARAVLGLPAYAIPAGFASMTAAKQLLTLSNLDRSLYGLQQIAGLNATINAAAQLGVTNGGDPIGVNVGSARWTSWASNWASGYPNAAFTYYAWMYDDGLGSPNGDCTASNSSGCWGHRLNTLHNFGSGAQIAMGVGSSGTTFTELYESFAASASIPY